jgi:hypothetical protein
MTEKILDRAIVFKNGKKVLLDGPLSRVITEALNDLYEKKIEPTTGIAIESQVMQVLQNANTFIEANTEQVIKENEYGVLYCVDSIDATVADFEKFTSTFNSLDNKQLRNSALIFNINEEQTPHVLIAAYEEFCDINHINMYTSLKTYMRDYKA